MSAAETQLAFQQADKNGDGFISLEELSNVFSSLGGVTKEEIQTMFKAVDVSSDGRVDYKEFVEWVMSAGDEDAPPGAEEAEALVEKVAAEYDVEGQVSSGKGIEDDSTAKKEGEPSEVVDAKPMYNGKEILSVSWAYVFAARVYVTYADGSIEDIDRALARELVTKFDFKIFFFEMDPDRYDPYAVPAWIREAVPKEAEDLKKPTGGGAYNLRGKITHEQGFKFL